VPRKRNASEQERFPKVEHIIMLPENEVYTIDNSKDGPPDSDNEGAGPQTGGLGTTSDLRAENLSKRNLRAMQKYKVQVKPSGKVTAGLGLYADEDLKAGHPIPVKGPWLFSKEERTGGERWWMGR